MMKLQIFLKDIYQNSTKGDLPDIKVENLATPWKIWRRLDPWYFMAENKNLATSNFCYGSTLINWVIGKPHFILEFLETISSSHFLFAHVCLKAILKQKYLKLWLEIKQLERNKVADLYIFV